MKPYEKSKNIKSLLKEFDFKTELEAKSKMGELRYKLFKESYLKEREESKNYENE
jgi:hypothetical protein